MRTRRSWKHSSKSSTKGRTKKMPTNELKPCPFCGGLAHTRQKLLIDGTHIGYVVFCSNCNVFLHGYRRKKTIEAWNTRAERTCKQVLTECNDGLMPPFTAHCSRCGAQWGYTPNYCPDCGARVVE